MTDVEARLMDKLVNAILLIISSIPTFRLLLSPVGADLYVQPCVDSESLHRSGLSESRERRLLFGTNAASPVSLASVLERDFSLSRMLVTFCERLNFFPKKRVRSVVLVFLKSRGDLKKKVCGGRLSCFVSYHACDDSEKIQLLLRKMIVGYFSVVRSIA